MTWPRLMSDRQARRYVGGLDPMLDLGVTPSFFRGERYYDRALIDRVLDANRDSAPAHGDDPESALQAWRDRRGAAAGRP
jgi:hypothetical protein